MVVREVDTKDITCSNEIHLCWRDFETNTHFYGYFEKASSFLHNYESTHGFRNDKFRTVKKLNLRYFKATNYKFTKNFI